VVGRRANWQVSKASETRAANYGLAD